MALGSSLGGFFGAITEPLTQKKARSSQFDLISQELDSVARDIRFQQAFGGISTSQPFKDIEGIRSEARRRLKGSSTLPSALSNALFSTFGGQGFSFAQGQLSKLFGKQ